MGRQVKAPWESHSTLVTLVTWTPEGAGPIWATLSGCFPLTPVAASFKGLQASARFRCLQIIAKFDGQRLCYKIQPVSPVILQSTVFAFWDLEFYIYCLNVYTL